MKHHLLKIMATVFFAVGTVTAPAAEMTGSLLYSGLTESGWQVCLVDLASGVSRPLTSSPGDKRRPFYLAQSGAVVCKDSMGRALAWKGGKEEVLSGDVLSAGDLWFPSNGKEWYFTRLATNNPQRQFIWHRKVDDPGAENQLVLRMEKGSLRQIALSPDGQWAAATHLWRVGEERILVFPLAAPETYRYLTPELMVAFSPTWAPDGKSLLFSMQREGSQDDFDLQRVSVDDARIQHLKRIEGSSEWFPSEDSSGRWVFFEENREGRSSLGALNSTTGEVVAIPLPHQGREPFWVSKIAP